MDVSRAVLDNLMGRDRNKPNDLITQRDHYSNPDVCKSFLICFCFNTLFPNTTYDEGPCEKRHDTYIKTMFDNDNLRVSYQRQYIKQCIHWIQRRLQQVQKKTKQNQSVIDNKSNFPTDRPKQILDRIFAVDQEIERLITQSMKYGQQGKIDDSVRCLEQVQKLRQRRKQIDMLGSDMTNAQKQQKICTICGAIQTINDTQKRVQTHLQGKIHQGFLKLRHQVQILRIRLQVLNKLNPQQKKQQKNHHNELKAIRLQQQQKERQNISHMNNNNRIQKQKSLSPKRKKDKKSRSKSKERKDKQRERQRQPRQRERQPRQREREPRERQRERQPRQRQKDRYYRDSRQRNDRQRRSSRDRERSRDRKQKKNYRDSREKQYRDKQRHHKQHKQNKDHKKKHRKNHSKSKQRDQKSNY